MCTLIVAWCVFSDPVVVAANRDEALDRPASVPHAWGEGSGIFAPRDECVGGTWIGTNDAGLFVAVTNRRVEIEGGGERSRGLLVADALGYESAAEAIDHVVAETDGATYSGFNLLIADAERAALIEWDGTRTLTEIDPGIHVVVNDGQPGVERKRRGVEKLVEPRNGESTEEWLVRVRSVLVDHDLGTCVHGEEYGTRSSSLVRVDREGNADWRFAPGPPCETEYASR
ncbi:NRDE family protein [Natronorarus salvus]|uniref:NRDE family protein n=1 Tax=Natronorarus salvus TaxID=3117733 RepID=UPI002F26BEAE